MVDQHLEMTSTALNVSKTSFTDKNGSAKFKDNWNLISPELCVKRSVCAVSKAAAHVEHFHFSMRAVIKRQRSMQAADSRTAHYGLWNGSIVFNRGVHHCFSLTFWHFERHVNSGIRLSHGLHMVTSTGNCTSSAQQWPKHHATYQQEVTENDCTPGAI